MPDTIPVVEIDISGREFRDTLADRLDNGGAASLAVAEPHDGFLATDDGTGLSVARNRCPRVADTIGILIELMADDQLDLETADAWLKRFADETDYRVPTRDISEYPE